MHELYPSKEALGNATVSGSTGGCPETFERLDERLVTLGAGVGVGLMTAGRCFSPALLHQARTAQVLRRTSHSGRRGELFPLSSEQWTSRSAGSVRPGDGTGEKP
jgi:hypothetical protein